MPPPGNEVWHRLTSPNLTSLGAKPMAATEAQLDWIPDLVCQVRRVPLLA